MLDRLRQSVGTLWPAAYWVGLPLSIAFVATLIADWAVSEIYELNQIEQQRSTRIRQFRTPEANRAIAVIGFNDESKSRLPLGPGGTLSRQNYAQLIRKLRKAGAKALLIDLVFDGEKPADDSELIKALHEPGAMGITLASILQVEPSFDSSEPDGLRWEFADLTFLDIDPNSESVRIGSNAPLRPAIHGIGVVMVRPSPIGEGLMPHVVLSAALHFHDISASELRFDPVEHELQAGSLEWSLQGNDAVLIQWTDDPRPFPTHDFADVILDLTEDELRRAFEGKIVLLGTLAQGVDVIEAEVGVMHGVEFLAQALNTVLLPPGERIRDADRFWTLVWFFTVSGFSALAGMSRRIVWSLVGVGGLLALTYGVPDLAARTLAVSLETVAPALAAGFAFLIGLGIRAWMPKPGRAAGSEFEATALFIDLKGSTNLLQTLGAQRFRKLYGNLSEVIASIVSRYQGQIERTTGDGALAVFPARSSKGHAVAAAQAANEIAVEMKKMAREQELPIGATFGLESGVLTGGYVSEGGQRAWSSSGSAINLAKRLQEAGEELRTDLRIGPTAARLMENQIQLEPCGTIRAQGFDTDVPVFRIKG